MTPPSEHLRALRARVPDVRLIAPRVALVLPAGDGRVFLDRDGLLPAQDLELESSLSTAARRLLGRLGLDAAAPLRPIAVRTGVRWQEEHDEVGPLQPLWVVVEVGGPMDAGAGGLEPGPPPPLLTENDGDPATTAAGEYVRAVRERIGHDRIFFPWSGLALRDARGAIFLVRARDGEQWHCPGGGIEPGETVPSTAVRELEEETGLLARPGRLVGTWSAHLRSFANGDRIQGVAVLLDGELVGGSLRPDATDEIDQAGWFGAGDLPPLRTPWEERVRLVLTGRGERLG